jgi:hypothetical protein
MPDDITPRHAAIIASRRLAPSRHYYYAIIEPPLRRHAITLFAE